MPFTALTQLGPLDTFLERSAESAMEAAGLQTVVATDTGVVSRSSITGDAMAAAREVAGALFDHLLAGTNEPRASTYLLGVREAIGL